YRTMSGSPPATQAHRFGSIGSIFVEVFLRDVVLRDLSGPDSSPVGVGCVLDAADDAGLEGLALFDQLLDALGVGQLGLREPFRVAGLAARLRTQPAKRRPRKDTGAGETRGTLRSAASYAPLFHYRHGIPALTQVSSASTNFS